MLISMTPNEEVKTIHASLNDGALRKWEFEPYTENGKIELTDQDYATIQSIKGNTVKFNQLTRYTNNGSSTVSGLTITNNNNGSFTISGTYNASGDRNMYGYISIISAVSGHKYLVKSTGSLMAGFVYGSASGNRDATKYIVTANSSGNMETAIRLIDSKANNGQVVNETIWINTFDLTLMGIDNLTTAEQVETWLSNNIGLLPYYDYTLGDLISFKGTGLKTENASQTESNTLSLGTLNTLFPTGMKEAGSVYDEISDKAYTRVGSVDLGTLDWSYYATWGIGGVFQSTSAISGIKNVDESIVGNFIVARYKTVSRNDNYSNYSTGSISISPTGLVQIRDSSYTDSATFKQMLSDQNVKLYFELATPIEQDISLDLTYPVYQDGTEQILPVNGSTPTTSPMVATIEYPDRTEDVNFLYKQTTFESAIPQFSLVCKNQELPMTLENDKLICECDSSITNESGFFDAKVKMQDLESVAYSQKIQLHVERGIND